jgi:hypothetical protein
MLTPTPTCCRPRTSRRPTRWPATSSRRRPDGGFGCRFGCTADPGRTAPPSPGVRSCRSAHVCCALEVSGRLVGPSVFKTEESGTAGLAGSIPVHLRDQQFRGRRARRRHCRPPRARRLDWIPDRQRAVGACPRPAVHRLNGAAVEAQHDRRATVTQHVADPSRDPNARTVLPAGPPAGRYGLAALQRTTANSSPTIHAKT